MPETVWLNGEFVDRAAARVSAFDAGVQHGVGLFETMLATGGRVFRIERHLARLAGSARELGLSDSLKTAPLAELVERVVERSELAVGEQRARVRLTITGGDLNLLSVSGRGGAVDPTIMIVVSPATEYPEEMFERGVGVIVPSERAPRLEPGAGHKTVNYWWRLRALRRAAGAGMGECLILQDTNHLCGGAVSNVFVVKGGGLLTPTARSEAGEDVPVPVLPGVTRGAVIELASSSGIGCERLALGIGDALEAQEVFLTNSAWGVLPVTRIEAHTVGTGEPGPVTRRLRELWLRAVCEEA